MTHISKYNEEVREESVFATPNPRTLGRGVRDFYSERDAVATPRRFTTIATPMSRKIKVVMIQIPDTQNLETISNWRI